MPRWPEWGNGVTGMIVQRWECTYEQDRYFVTLDNLNGSWMATLFRYRKNTFDAYVFDCYIRVPTPTGEGHAGYQAGEVLVAAYKADLVTLIVEHDL